MKTLPGLALFAAAALIFVHAPDIDQRFLGILHHRSILTHSLLLPILLMLLAREEARGGLAAGAMLGVSVHLSADLLSPMRGFARIWTPEPFQHSLGLWPSYGWIFINAVIGFMAARSHLERVVGRRFNMAASFAMGAPLAAWYGVENEHNPMAILAAMGVMFVAFVLGEVRRA